MREPASAFPVDECRPGLTKREWFAGMALQVIHSDGGRYGPEGMKQVAEYAYAMADAMIEAGKEKP